MIEEAGITDLAPAGLEHREALNMRSLKTIDTDPEVVGGNTGKSTLVHLDLKNIIRPYLVNHLIRWGALT